MREHVGTITVEEVNGYSVRVLRVFEDGRPVATLSDPDLDALALPGSLPGRLVRPVAEAVFAFLITKEQARYTD